MQLKDLFSIPRPAEVYPASKEAVNDQVLSTSVHGGNFGMSNNEERRLRSFAKTLFSIPR